MLYYYNMKLLNFSRETSISNELVVDKDIHIFTQFFIHKDAKRYNEIRYCLRQNVDNPDVFKIHLLGERLYTDSELGTRSDKIVQHVIGRRLRFSDVFSYIRSNSILGYHVLLNSDICFANDALPNLLKSDIDSNKKMFALLRFEYKVSDPEKSPIFGPRFDSQDTWIFHSNFPISEKEDKLFSFEFGKPGCDNKIIYLVNVLGYEVLNDPYFIKTYHIHKSQYRDYSAKDVIPDPWGIVAPAHVDPTILPQSLGINMANIKAATNGFRDVQFSDNTTIYNYVLGKIQSGKNFILPRVSGIENNFAVFGRITKQGGSNESIMNYFQHVVGAMKNNAGIKLSNMQSIIKYSDLYLKAFDQCEMMAGWDLQGNYIGHIADSHEYLKKTYPEKRMVWALALDVFHYIYANPWTTALRGKRVLIISTFEESIKEKIPIREKIYGIDLFPDCTISTIRPPQTQAGEPSEEFDVELDRFLLRLDDIRDTYDVALVSCGGYANPVCAHIFESGKSAVYVGGVLQMYFGILGSRWLKERPDIIRLFLNEHWSRPKVSEKPANFGNVEGGCYW